MPLPPRTIKRKEVCLNGVLAVSQARIAKIHMSNTYGVSDEDEKAIRARDKTCVYCRKPMKKHPHKMDASGPTLEHFNNDGPLKKKYNLAICCRRCNSSKGTKKLSPWFETPYCIERNINQKTIAKPVREYIRGYGGRRRRPQAAHKRRFRS
jgi:hypothetical protein